MVLIIELGPAEAQELQRRARELGMQPDQYARMQVVEGLSNRGALAQSPACGDRRMTGAEAMDYWCREGVLGLFADRPDNPEYARELRRLAENRDRIIRRS